MTKKRILSLLTINLTSLTLLSSGFVNPVNIYAQQTEQIENVESTNIKSIDECDLSDFSNWKSGCYNWTDGEYVDYPTRICLTEYKKISSKAYKFSISSNSYQLAIREKNADGIMIKSIILKSGDTYTPSENTDTIGITLYKYYSEDKDSYDVFKTMFDNGFSVKLEPIVTDDNLIDDSSNISDDTNVPVIKTNNIDECDLSDFSNWKSGCYNWTDGEYIKYPTRICLDEYKSFSSKEYKVYISNTSYQITVREKNADGKFIKSTVLKNEDVYKPSDDAVSIGVTLYKLGKETDSYDTFKTMFDNGFSVKLKPVITNTDINSPGGSNTSSTPATKTSIIDDCDLNDLSNWKSGCYNYQTSDYEENAARICLNEYKTLKYTKYSVSISNDKYKLAIRERDKDGNFIKTVILKDGDIYTVGNTTKSIGVTLYRANDEWGINYNSYVNLFNNGFSIKLTADESCTKEYINFKEELRDMLESGDMTTHDISKYNLTYQQMNAVYNELAKGECYLAVKAYKQCSYLKTEMENNKVKTIYMTGADKDFPERYALMKTEIKNVLSKITPEMTEMDKMLYFHEYLVDKTTYSEKDKGVAHSASGPLAYGYGVCEGYAKALEVLLHETGMESYNVSSNKLNHMWNIVVIDGERYHIDTTWDDTRTRKSGEVDHNYFIRNDNEFRYNAGYTHYDWYSDSLNNKLNITGRDNTYSTSTKYTDWFVHDVVGKMFYSNGYWYYAENNTLVKSKIDGSDKSIIYTGTSSLKLISIENRIILYKEAEENYVLNI